MPQQLATGALKEDECGRVTGMPKVALLFLTRGPMPHEQLWYNWFEQAAGEQALAANAFPNSFCMCGSYSLSQLIFSSVDPGADASPEALVHAACQALSVL